MNEIEAQAWLSERVDVPRGTLKRLDCFIRYLRAEAARQNLVASSTLDTIWSRHIVDSVQLIPLATTGSWIDLGSGAGFPGLIVAALRPYPTLLVESRRKRVAFLTGAIDLLDISAHTTVIHARAETMLPTHFATISARAFASLDTIFMIGARFAGPHTRWILPKGRNAQAELVAARQKWQGDFRIHASITDPDSAIIVAERVRPRTKR